MGSPCCISTDTDEPVSPYWAGLTYWRTNSKEQVWASPAAYRRTRDEPVSPSGAGLSYRRKDSRETEIKQCMTDRRSPRRRWLANMIARHELQPNDHMLRVGMRIYFLKSVEFHLSIFCIWRSEKTWGSGSSSCAYAEAMRLIELEI
jgi:hypothetical protein